MPEGEVILMIPIKKLNKEQQREPHSVQSNPTQTGRTHGFSRGSRWNSDEYKKALFEHILIDEIKKYALETVNNRGFKPIGEGISRGVGVRRDFIAYPKGSGGADSMAPEDLKNKQEIKNDK